MLLFELLLIRANIRKIDSVSATSIVESNLLLCSMQQQGKKYLQLIGNNIRKKRNQLGISQQELADNADIAKSTLQRIEKGDMNPSILTLKSISIALDIDLSELI